MEENSIEEDIKSINKGLYELEDSYELHQARWAKRIFENIKEKLEHILSDYKRVLKENKELKKHNEKYIIHLTDEQYKIVIENAQNDINQKWIQKVKDKIEEINEELEIMKVDNMYGRYKEYGGKSKWERLFATKYGMHDALQELLEGRK